MGWNPFKDVVDIFKDVFDFATDPLGPFRRKERKRQKKAAEEERRRQIAQQRKREAERLAAKYKGLGGAYRNLYQVTRDYTPPTPGGITLGGGGKTY